MEHHVPQDTAPDDAGGVMRCDGIEATRAACLEGELAPVGHPDVRGGLGALTEAEVPPT
mgnify:CR=1 FL=1